MSSLGGFARLERSRKQGDRGYETIEEGELSVVGRWPFGQGPEDGLFVEGKWNFFRIHGLAFRTNYVLRNAVLAFQSICNPNAALERMSTPRTEGMP